MKKIKIFLIIILTIICCGCNNKSSLNKEELNKDKYIVIDEYKVLNYKNNTWRVLDNINNNINSNQEFKIYNNNQYINNYYFKLNNNTGYYFDEDYKSYEVNSNLAINANIETEPITYSETEFTNEDYDISLKLLKKLKYNYSIGLSINKKYITNTNKDNENESLYIISNYSPQTPDTEVFYIVFLRENNKNIIITNQNNETGIKFYDIAWILNITNGKYSDIILKYTYTEADEYDVYQYINNKYQLVIDKDEVIKPEKSKITIEINYTMIMIVSLIIVSILFLIFITYKKRSELANKI